ncbi:hypothetical protein [Hamadaea tsunoensis]|uniref:hypothetical protein n=1 Tax=Hamadaea tsunoensis TaxID=53368 RepID=UPI000481F23E|nr:hypothetical protein [Hamadaea tsunoensis]
MATMKRVPPPDCPPELPISALIPMALPRPRPEPAPVGDLPPVTVDGADVAVLVIARLNPSGQISVRTLLPALGWTPGERIAFTVERRCIVVAATDHRGRALGTGGLLVLPVAARRMCAFPSGSQVLVAALPDAGVLVVHSIGVIARQLARRHGQIVRSRDGHPT